jgi:hypothetical protein
VFIILCHLTSFVSVWQGMFPDQLFNVFLVRSSVHVLQVALILIPSARVHTIKLVVLLQNM